MAAHLSFDHLMSALAAAGEPTRFRLLALLAEAELTVSEIVTILGQSQPRVSRHLKLLGDAGLVTRHREGAWAFFRLSGDEIPGHLARDLLSYAAVTDPQLQADRQRLDEVRRARAEQAARYFAQHARSWDEIRSLHAPEALVEEALRAALGSTKIRHLLDLGTGTGRMLEVLAPLYERAIGVDQSSSMLALARARIEQAGLRQVLLRQGDLFAPPVERGAFDLIMVHQVLHFLDDPSRALREASQLLQPGGRLAVIDFAPHEEEHLRQNHAHRRLGFAREEIEQAMREVGLEMLETRAVSPGGQKHEKLTVLIWLARRRSDTKNLSPEKEVA